MTKLSKLLWMLSIACEDERTIIGITDDTRELKKDWLYVCRCVSGKRKHEYIKQALQLGAVVLCDQYEPQEHVYVCEHIEDITQVLIELFYGDLCANLQVIGVTGTNGKTSVSSYVYQMMNMSGKRYMRIGTGEVCFEHQQQHIANTTPDRFQLAQWFYKANVLGLDGIVMEVSSHAIDANRICFIQFDCIVYTNITQDHLDYHITKTHYRFTKFKLRRYLKDNGCVIYNNDLPEMKEFPLLYQGKRITIGREAHFPIRKVSLSDHDTSFEVQGYEIHVNLLGMINVYNVVSAIVVARVLSISYEAIRQGCEHLQPVAGRMELLPFQRCKVWIDYAHTPDALDSLLQFANQVKKGSVLCIIGCGGNRDKTKRRLMAEVVANGSDVAIFTSDNPRYEKIQDILMDMCQGCRQQVEVFENRYFAIKHAVTIAQNSDIIIIAGKGSEAIQSIEGHEYPFSDKEVVSFLMKDEEENHWK